MSGVKQHRVSQASIDVGTRNLVAARGKPRRPHSTKSSRPDDKRHLPKPWLLRITDAMKRAAELRPVGSVNMEVLRRSRGTGPRHLREAEEKGRALLPARGLITLGDLHALGGVADGTPCIAILVDGADALHFMPIERVEEKLTKVGPTPPRVLVHTRYGMLLLPAGTVVVVR
jgi:hypothetical protein